MSLQLETQGFVNRLDSESGAHSLAGRVAPESTNHNGDEVTVFDLLLKDLLLIGSALAVIALIFVFGITHL